MGIHRYSSMVVPSSVTTVATPRPWQLAIGNWLHSAMTSTPALSPPLHVHTPSNSAFCWLPSPPFPPRPPFPLHLWHLFRHLSSAHPCPTYARTAFPWTLSSLIVRSTSTWVKPSSHQGPAPNNEA